MKTSVLNAGVFIDYENVYYALLNDHTNVVRLGFFERLKAWCESNDMRIIKELAYCNFDIPDLSMSHHQTLLQDMGIETVHTSCHGKNYADVKLSVDIMSSLYSECPPDVYILMSNDRDMVPLIHAIRGMHYRVVLITTGSSYNNVLMHAADEHRTVREIADTEIEHTCLETISDTYWNNHLTFVRNQIGYYRQNGKFFHSSLNYVLNNQIRYSNVPRYEMAAIISDLYAAQKIFFYTTDANGVAYVNFAPVDLQATLLQDGIIGPDQLLYNWDIESTVTAEYARALGTKEAFIGNAT